MIAFQGGGEIAWPLGIETDHTFGRREHKKDDGIMRLLKRTAKLDLDPKGNAGDTRGLIRMLRKRENGKAKNKNAWIRIL